MMMMKSIYSPPGRSPMVELTACYLLVLRAVNISCLHMCGTGSTNRSRCATCQGEEGAGDGDGEGMSVAAEACSEIPDNTGLQQ
jgi:hypothetical protein